MSTCPSTPPRSKERQINEVNIANSRTPKTPQHGFGAPLMTPKSIRKSKNNNNHNKHLQTPVKNIQVLGFAPVSPELTPFKSPRRKRRVLDLDQTSTTKFDDNFGKMSHLSTHILPAPSTVGSGRKVNPTSNNKLLNPPPKLEFSFFDDIAHEEEDLEDMSLKYMNEGNVKFLNNLLQYQPESPSRTKPKLKKQPQQQKQIFEPLTPNKQLIDDATINNWHAKSKNIHFSPDEDQTFWEAGSSSNIVKTKLQNPFLQDLDRTCENYSILQDSPAGNVDYSTHNEYFNKSTGKRTLIKLTEEEAKIKPKRLDFKNI